MLIVRLQRIGKRGQAYFRVIVTEHTKKPKGEYLELLGTYNPHEKILKVKKDRIEYWVSNGAQTSPTVNNLLINHKVWDKEKVQSWRPKIKPKVETPVVKVVPPLAGQAKTEAPKEEIKEEPVPVEAPAEQPQPEAPAEVVSQ